MSRTQLEATTAYYRTVPAVGLLRLAMGFLQRLWPALAVRAASRLFLTPLPPKWLARGTSWSADWTVSPLPFEDAAVTLYEHGGAGPVVLLAHGWGGHAGQMKTLAAALVAAGLRPIIMEMPAHGRSAGLQSNLPQFARAIDYVVARLAENGRPVQALVAHSLGASAAAFATARNLPVGRLVLVAPAASPPAYTRMFAHIVGLSERTRAAMPGRAPVGIDDRVEFLQDLLEARQQLRGRIAHLGLRRAKVGDPQAGSLVETVTQGLGEQIVGGAAAGSG